tara:strand:- start:3637 stop:4104 length:468 start_codon:yes stop_codon:yes gene_type:complete
MEEIMSDHSKQTPSAFDLPNAIDGQRGYQTHQAPSHRAGEARVVVDDGQHTPSLLHEFHSAVPSFMRDEFDGGVGSTDILPADKSCKQTCPRVIQFPLAVPPPAQLGNAMAIASHPEEVHDRPILRRLAWSTLMAARGNRVNQTRLAKLQRGMVL